MEGEDVSAFAFTYQNKMTGELGHLKIEGYNFWEAFRGQCILRFALTHEGERSLALKTKVIYKGNIDRYLLEMENHNTHVGMSEVAWRQMVERHIPKDVLRRLSTEEYATDSAWITAREQSVGENKYSWNNSPYSTVVLVFAVTTQVEKEKEKKRLSQSLGNEESNILLKKKQPRK